MLWSLSCTWRSHGPSSAGRKAGLSEKPQWRRLDVAAEMNSPVSSAAAACSSVTRRTQEPAWFPEVPFRKSYRLRHPPVGAGSQKSSSGAGCRTRDPPVPDGPRCPGGSSTGRPAYPGGDMPAFIRQNSSFRSCRVATGSGGFPRCRRGRHGRHCRAHACDKSSGRESRAPAEIYIRAPVGERPLVPLSFNLRPPRAIGTPDSSAPAAEKSGPHLEMRRENLNPSFGIVQTPASSDWKPCRNARQPRRSDPEA